MKKPNSKPNDNSAEKRLETADQAQACCQRIITVAALLEAFGAASKDDMVESEVVAHAGQMIGDEALQLRWPYQPAGADERCSPVPRNSAPEAQLTYFPTVVAV